VAKARVTRPLFRFPRERVPKALPKREDLGVGVNNRETPPPRKLGAKYLVKGTGEPTTLMACAQLEKAEIHDVRGRPPHDKRGNSREFVVEPQAPNMVTIGAHLGRFVVQERCHSAGIGLLAVDARRVATVVLENAKNLVAIGRIEGANHEH